MRYSMHTFHTGNSRGFFHGWKNNSHFPEFLGAVETMTIGNVVGPDLSYLLDYVT